MPTKHRRIAIVRDQEVEDALEAARALGNASKSDAAVARDLILRGERAMRAEGIEDPWERRMVEEYGARPAKRSLREVLDELGPLPPYDPDDPYPAQRILEELREDTI